MPAAATVSLDHLSIGAAPGSVEALGFELAPSTGGGHGRALLDRTYLEVIADADAGERLRAGGWFLRPADLDAAAARLADAGIVAAGPRPYEGRDGQWLDLVVSGDGPQPTLTIRTDLPAGAWPPALERPHPNGATALAEIRVRAARIEPLAATLLALGACEEEGHRFRLPGGGTVALEPGAGAEGVIAASLTRPGDDPLELDLEP